MQYGGPDDERDDEATVESDAPDDAADELEDEPEVEDGSEGDDADVEDAEADAGEESEATDTGPTRAELQERLAALEAERAERLTAAPDARVVTQEPPTDDDAAKERELLQRHRDNVSKLQHGRAVLAQMKQAMAQSGGPTDPLIDVVEGMLDAQEIQLAITARALGKTTAKTEALERERAGERDERYVLANVDKPQQAAFRAFVKANSQNFRDIASCHLAFEGHMLRQQREALAKPKNGKANPASPTKKLGPAPRPVTASEKAQRGVVMTEDQLDKRVERLHASGRHDEARRLLATVSIKD